MRLLVVKLSSLGDLVHAMPAIERVRQGLGVTQFDWITQPEYESLVRCIDGVERVIPFPRRNLLTGFGAFRRQLRMREYDLVVDFQGLWKSAIATRSAKLASGGRRIGPSFAREGCGMLYHQCAPGTADRHAVERCLDIPLHLGFGDQPVQFPFVPPAVPEPAGEIPIAIFPKSRWLAKNWPLEYLAVLSKRLLEREGVHLHFLGGPKDGDVCEALVRELGSEGGTERATNHAGTTPLPQLLGTIARMRLLIGNDSGPLHLAAAVGTPVLAFYGPTDPARTGPWGKATRVLEAPRDGSSYKAENDRVIRKISIDQAHAAAVAILDQVTKN